MSLTHPSDHGGTALKGGYANAVTALALSEDETAAVDEQLDLLYDAYHEEVGGFLDCEGSGLCAFFVPLDPSITEPVAY